MEGLLVGHARQCITPPLGIRMVGYADRTDGAAEVHDDLFLNAVVLEAPDNTVALVAYDVCLLRLEQAARIKAALQQGAGLRPEQVLLNTSHTHAGPALDDGEDAGPLEREYWDRLVQETVEAVRGAMAETRPATFRVGAAPLDIGCNRRERIEDGSIILGHNPEGLRLAELTVWHFERSAAAHVALFSTPMHGTTLGGGNLSISSEWMGEAVRRVEADQPGLKLVFLQGCGADQDPYYSMQEGRRGTFEEVAQHGARAAEAVAQAMRDAEQLEPLPLRELVHEVSLPGKEDAAETHRMPLHAVRLGDAALVALGAEAFVEFALFGRSVSPFDETLVLGYTNGNVGYLCTGEVSEEGGYEARTTRVAPQSERLAKDAIEEVLTRLAASSFVP
jgi:hypothetical protein